MRKLLFFTILFSIIIAGCSNCKNYTEESCPDSCVVCPPCEECSSLSCQTESFCESIGFDRDWYNTTKGGDIECEVRTEACTMDYTPVCANVRVECITTPCNPVQETYSNACTACSNERVISYRIGEC